MFNRLRYAWRDASRYAVGAPGDSRYLVARPGFTAARSTRRAYSQSSSRRLRSQGRSRSLPQTTVTGKRPMQGGGGGPAIYKAGPGAKRRKRSNGRFKRRRNFGRKYRVRKSKGWQSKVMRANAKVPATQQVLKDISFSALNYFGVDDESKSQLGHNTCGWYSVAGTTSGQLDNVLMACGNVAASSSLDDDFRALLIRAYTKVKLKNNGSLAAEVTMYRCTPRKKLYSLLDYPAVTHGIFGGNPPLLVTAGDSEQPDQFATAMSMINFDAEPYNSNAWCSAFKVKRAWTKCLNPGDEADFFIPTWRKFSGSTFSKRQFNVESSETIAAQQQYVNLGPLLLFRARGCLAHNEDDITSALSTVIAGTPAVNFDTGAHYSNFNIDLAIHRVIKFAKLDQPQSYKSARRSAMPNPDVGLVADSAAFAPDTSEFAAGA